MSYVWQIATGMPSSGYLSARRVGMDHSPLEMCELRDELFFTSNRPTKSPTSQV